MLYLNDTLLKYIFTINVLVYTNCSEGTGCILLLLYLLHKICGQVFCRGDTHGFRLREVLDNKPDKVHHLVGFGYSNSYVIGTQSVLFQASVLKWCCQSQFFWVYLCHAWELIQGRVSETGVWLGVEAKRISRCTRSLQFRYFLIFNKNVNNLPFSSPSSSTGLVMRSTMEKRQPSHPIILLKYNMLYFPQVRQYKP